MSSLFFVLLGFSKSLATKCLFLNDEPCMVRSTLIDMNPNELKYYPLMISLNKCAGIYNVLSPKICIPKETKDINVKALNMITNKDEAKLWQNICHVIVIVNSIVQHLIQSKNGIIKHVDVNVKIIVSVKKIIV